MSNIWDIEPPRWLQADAKGIDAQKSGELFAGLLGGGLSAITNTNNVIGQDDKGKDIHKNFWQTLGDGIEAAQDPFYMEKAEAMRAGAELKHAQTADKLKGMKEYAEAKKNTPPNQVWNTPYPGTSFSGAQAWQKDQLADWQRHNQEQAIAVKQKEAENAVEQARQRAASLAERIRHDKAVETGTGMAEPETKEFDDGSKLIHVSPNRWQYVKDGNKKEMSTSQLMAISKSLKDLDPKDTTASTIDEALKAKAVQQVSGKGKTADTPAKVSTYNDEDEARTDGKKAGDIVFLYGIGKVKLK